MTFKKIAQSCLAHLGVLALLLGAEVAYGAPDFSLSTYYRSEPVGGAAEGEAGYTQRFWGFSAQKETSPWFGYIRPFAGSTQIEDYQATYGGVDLFPIGLMGARIVTTAVENTGGYEAFDCETYLCDGRFREDRLQLFLLVPVNPFYLAGSWTRDHLVSRGENRKGAAAGFTQYIHPSSGLPVQNTLEDFIDRATVTMGYRFNDQWSLLAQYIHWRVDSNPMESRMTTAGFSYALRYLDIKFMAGTYRSDLPEVSNPAENRRESTLLFNVAIPILPKDGYF